MRETVTVPELGENIDSVEVVSVLVKAGDTVAVDQSLIEVETEKAAVEVPSSVAGVVAEVLVAAGEQLGAGDAIVVVDTPTAEQAAPPADSAAVVDQPESADSEEAAVSAEESAPATPSAPVVDVALPTPKAPPRAHGGSAVAPTWAASPGPPNLVPATPSVRRFAREIGVDIGQVRGTGPRGRITTDDVKRHAQELLARAAAARALPGIGEQPTLPDFAVWGDVDEQPMSKIRRLTAENVARAWTTIPQVTNHDLADITELERLRKRFRARVEAAGGKLTVTAILVKIVASALKVSPKLNASVDMDRHTVVHKRYVHVGVAVDTEHGLLVPVIRDADHKNITEIAVELDDLATRARSRKLKPDEMQGASFTISNLGGIGGIGFSPIVNWPQVALLGVSRARMQQEWQDGDFEPRLMLPLSLSYDHRVVDGADAARFLRWVAEAIEQPLVLALEG